MTANVPSVVPRVGDLTGVASVSRHPLLGAQRTASELTGPTLRVLDGGGLRQSVSDRTLRGVHGEYSASTMLNSVRSLWRVWLAEL
jgi:hypothetical protein